jgi:hypothetical protein
MTDHDPDDDLACVFEDAMSQPAAWYAALTMPLPRNPDAGPLI